MKKRSTHFKNRYICIVMIRKERKIIVITQERITLEEAAPIAEMINTGCDRVHIRKPGADPGDIRRYLDLLCPMVDTRKLSMHYYFDIAKEYSFGGLHGMSLPDDFYGTKSCSCHSISELYGNVERMDYMFISPVFDSISKAGYKAGVDISAVKDFFNTADGRKAVALGGISADNINNLSKMGFTAAALLGSVWKDGESMAANNFKEIAKLWK